MIDCIHYSVFFSLLAFKQIILSNTSENLLLDLNTQFLNNYQRAKGHITNNIDPLIILNGDFAILSHNKQRIEEKVIPKLYHDLKTISHIPFNIYLLLIFDVKHKLSTNKTVELKQYLKDLRHIRLQLNKFDFHSHKMDKNQYQIIDLSIDYIRNILKTKRIDNNNLNEFCIKARSLFTINIEYAAQIHLDMLHSKVGKWYNIRFNETEKQHTKILIFGMKTARHGHLEKSYFYRLFGEKREGNHILYIENMSEEQQGIDILGTWILDSKASSTFFGNKEHLHQDVLMDASKKYIKKLFKK
ncbi:unnamed protein product [Didymodactylos carnosus]|uniref:Uncharacterized protein n=1 Tax=Didymodactylos carnosus TaxID=1234261 RepID=A0A814VSE8_9BILA|nr:unnamed protein product [Didymodactylos carnosus]CAF1195015.1 unnamed protein product [Didymodactylos carnosus]CAF3637105.1 unnamed protein product [Didymodactylos carnosus]CAF3959485.1 unnamed protein product [Didymodactylos carnosus]